MWANIIIREEMVSYGKNVIMREEMLSCEVRWSHEGGNFITKELMFPRESECYHVGGNVIMWEKCFIERGTISCGRKYYYGRKCYQERDKVFIWDEM
jgi:hypothetical protein